LYQQLEDWRVKEMMTIEMGGSEGMDRRKLVEKLLDKVRTHSHRPSLTFETFMTLRSSFISFTLNYN
jgi:hypothetical protein